MGCFDAPGFGFAGVAVVLRGLKERKCFEPCRDITAAHVFAIV
jgi:hypothetical protein